MRDAGHGYISMCNGVTPQFPLKVQTPKRGIGENPLITACWQSPTSSQTALDDMCRGFWPFNRTGKARSLFFPDMFIKPPAFAAMNVGVGRRIRTPVTTTPHRSRGGGFEFACKATCSQCARIVRCMIAKDFCIAVFSRAVCDLQPEITLRNQG